MNDTGNLMQLALEMRKALEILVSKLTDETDAVQMPSLYPSYDDYVKSEKKIPAGQVIRHGTNAVGDPQLYRTVLDTVPNPKMGPDKIATSFLPVGTGESGYPVWVQPLWYLDTYQVGDKVDRNGTVYINEKADNMNAPEKEKSGWRKAVATEL